MAITPAEIVQRIEDKEYLLINLENCNYYISERGEIFSLNKPAPRMLNPTPHGNGELSITLYVPRLQTFNVADLVLRTFKREATEGEFACYSNGNPLDVNVKNLYWGTLVDRNKWRSKTSMLRSKEVVSKAKGIETELLNLETSYYCNTSFLFDILRFVIQLNRLSISAEFCEEDVSILQRCLEELSEITAITVLNFSKLVGVFEANFEADFINELFAEYKDVLVKNRKAYCSL